MPVQQIPVGQASSLLANEILERDGCVVLTGITGEATRAELLRELQEYQGNDSIAEEQGEDAFYPGNTKRTTALVAKSEVARGFMVHPALLALADTYLGPSCNQVQLSVCSALNIGPGARSQRLHREDGPYPSAMKHVLPGSDLVLWSMWAITEFTQENGATLVVPGSHKWEPEREALEHEVTCAAMPAGSVLISRGGLLHAAGANLTATDWRVGVFMSYTLGWLRQEENLYVDVPPEVAIGFSADVRKLLGYDAHGALGFFDADALAQRLHSSTGDYSDEAKQKAMGDDPRINFAGRL